MGRNFKEIGKKIQELIHEGNKAENRLAETHFRVESLRNEVEEAKRELMKASQLDSEGHTKGDVEMAEISVRIAENQLSAAERAESVARVELKEIEEEKRNYISTIEEYERIERSNLKKLEGLSSNSFSDNVNETIKDMAERLNSAEDSKISLLDSLGISETAQYYETSFEGTDDYEWSLGGFDSLDLSGTIQELNQGTNPGSPSSFSQTEQESYSTYPINFDTTISNIGQENSTLNLNNNVNRDSDRFIPGVDRVSNTGDILSSFDILVDKIMNASFLTNGEKISALFSLKDEILRTVNSKIVESETESVKVLRRFKTSEIKALTEEEKKTIGNRHIANTEEIIQDNLVDMGVTSILGIKQVQKEIREYLEKELSKDLKNLENDLYGTIDYGALADKANHINQTIADQVKSEPMSFTQADTFHVNPFYKSSKRGFKINCQSCVVVFEARQRGYHVEVLPFKKSSSNSNKSTAFEILADDPRLAYIDPRTGKPPEYIYDPTRNTVDSFYDFLDRVIKQDQRYTIQYHYKGRNFGHIVNIDRNKYGDIRIKDNQPSKDNITEWVGPSEIRKYLSRMVLKKGRFSHKDVPRILRIDNLDFNYDIVNEVMRDESN